MGGFMNKKVLKLAQEVQTLIEHIEARDGYLHFSIKRNIVNATYGNDLNALVQIKWMLQQIWFNNMKVAA